jgi:dUTP pyrophosphatase
VSAPIRIDICQLLHGEGLPLPEYQSPHAAGLDLLAAVPKTLRWSWRQGNARWCRPG